MPNQASLPGSAALPTPNEAAESLAQARMAMQRTRRDVAGSSLWPHTITGGAIWIGGFTATQFLSPGASLIAWILCAIIANTAYHLMERKEDHFVENGLACRVHRIWLVFFAGMLCLDFIITNSPQYVVALVNGTVWGIAIIVYSILLENREHALLGGGLLLLAVILRFAVPHWSPLLFGLIGGGSMLTLGAVQMWQVRRQW